MKIVTGAGIATVLVLGGCAMVDKDAGRPPSNCAAGACQIEVTVVSCTDIKASKEPIVVAPGYSGPMQWRLDTRTGWEFTQGGIQIRQGSDREFEPAPGNSASVVTWKNNHRNANKTYKYDVVVMKSSTSEVCRWDPSIMN